VKGGVFVPKIEVTLSQGEIEQAVRASVQKLFPDTAVKVSLRIHLPSDPGDPRGSGQPSVAAVCEVSEVQRFQGRD
jgi:hypothetical protein